MFIQIEAAFDSNCILLVISKRKIVNGTHFDTNVKFYKNIAKHKACTVAKRTEEVEVEQNILLLISIIIY